MSLLTAHPFLLEAEPSTQTKSFVAIVREALHRPPAADAQLPTKGFFAIAMEALREPRAGEAETRS